MRRFLIFMAIVFTLSACASSPPQAQRSEFEDVPVPKGLVLDWSRSTIIESPTIKAARLFYRGGSSPTASPSRSGPPSRPMAGAIYPPQRLLRGAPRKCTKRRVARSRS
jgi:hypothetical protein